MKIIKARPGDYINVGQAGEELARRVEFIITEFEDLYGPGMAQFLVQRMGDAEFYPVAITQEPGKAIWTVTVPENLVVGRQNKYQLRYYAGETLATSVIGQFAVNDGFVGDGGEVPEVHKGWTEQVLDAAVRAEDAAQRAEDAAERVENAGGGGTELPPGGTKGQVLGKRSDVDGDVEWVDQTGGTGFAYEIGHGLKVVDDSTLEVDAVSDFEGDNTLPITAAAVQTTVGNIEIILATI